MEFVSLKVSNCDGLCIAIDESAEGGWLPVVVESRGDAVIFLGALCDGENQPWDWMEIWVQETASISTGLSSVGKGLGNLLIDERWRRAVKGHVQTGGRSIFRGDWEFRHPAPVWIDRTDGKRMSEFEGWSLCEDDAALKSAGLPEFSTSIHRYLTDGEGFLALGEEAPLAPGVKSLGSVYPNAVALNGEAGLMMVRRLPGLRYEEFVDFLSGRDFGDDPGELLRIGATEDYRGFLNRNSMSHGGFGYIFGKARLNDRLGEVLLLKLCVLRGAFAAVQAGLEANKLPYLSLNGQSFGVRLAEPSGVLPFLWNHRVELCAVSNVIAMPLGIAGEEALVQIEESPRSIYSAGRMSSGCEGSGRVRVRKVTPPDDAGLSIIEGTLETDEGLDVSRKDLLEIELRLSRGRRLKIYGNFLPKSGDGCEYRFLSFPHALPDEVMKELEKGGVGFSERVNFKVSPRLGATCDLFSLGVLAVRTIFSGVKIPLSETVDDILALIHAHSAKLEGSGWDTGGGRLLDFIGSDAGAAWQVSLGYNRLVEATAVSEDAIPDRLWWDVVNFIGRLFPGEMIGSFRKDYDDFEARAPQLVLAEPLEVLDGLIEQCRVLLFGDPVAGHEIGDVIKNLLGKSR